MPLTFQGSGTFTGRGFLDDKRTQLVQPGHGGPPTPRGAVRPPSIRGKAGRSSPARAGEL